MSEVMEGGANNVTCRWPASDSLDLDLGKTDNHEARYQVPATVKMTSVCRCCGFSRHLHNISNFTLPCEHI